jgi:ABC-type phosphate transport system substrate-binding protein
MSRRVLMIAAVMAVSLVAAARDVALVTGKSGNIQAIAAQDLIKMCSGKTTKWPDGKDVKIFVSDPASPDMKLVAEKIFNASGQDFRAFLQKIPGVRVLTSDQAVVMAVQEAPGSIGFVDIYSITGAVAVVRVEGKLPLEPGYVLHRSQ